MESSASYVALARHRDGVALHCGGDDFADRDALINVLSRERANDVASDYVRAPEPGVASPVRPDLNSVVAHHGKIGLSLGSRRSRGNLGKPAQESSGRTG